MMNKITKITVSAIALALVTMAPARATETLTLTDGAGNTATGVASTTIPGLITFNGVVGSWTLNLTLGISVPLIGSTTAPAMDLISIDQFNATGAKVGGNALTISLSESGLGPTTGIVTSGISGTQSRGNVSFSTSANGSGLTASGPLTTAPFSSSQAGSLSGFTGTLTETVVLIAGGSECVGLDATFSTAPGPVSNDNPVGSVPDSGMTLVLLGAGLIALGLYARLRKPIEA